MQRTTGIQSDIGGRSRTLLWEADEIGMSLRTITAQTAATSETIYVEGFEHFHIYVARSDTTVPIEIAIVPMLPVIGASPPVVVANFVLTMWLAGGPVPGFGVFYFGSKLALTGSGKSFRFGPLFIFQVINRDPVNPVTITAHLHAQD